jgi:hypothetical protein
MEVKFQNIKRWLQWGSLYCLVLVAVLALTTTKAYHRSPGAENALEIAHLKARISELEAALSVSCVNPKRDPALAEPMWAG